MLSPTSFALSFNSPYTSEMALFVLPTRQANAVEGGITTTL
jgi:hypothetical protein